MKDRKKGSVLLLVLFLTVTIGGLTAALFRIVLPEHRASSESLDNALAYRAAESGVGYYLAQLILDEYYFGSYPAPHSPIPIGQGSFELASAEPGDNPNKWILLVNGWHDRGGYRMGAIVGYEELLFPPGFVMAGTGDPDDVVFELNGGGTITNYDSSLGPPLSASNPGGDVEVGINGSGSIVGSTTVNGNVHATGSVNLSGDSDIV